nr:hypothetical protein [uncultured Campylobacter sp.]
MKFRGVSEFYPSRFRFAARNSTEANPASKISKRIEPAPKFHRQHKILPLKISRGKFCAIKFHFKSRGRNFKMKFQDEIPKLKF